MSNKEIQSFKLDDINDIGYATFSRVDMPSGGQDNQSILYRW